LEVIGLSNDFFKSIEQKTGVNKQELFQLVDSVSHMNFKNEDEVRKVIRAVSRLANKSVSKEKEEYLVKAITNNKLPKDLSSLLGGNKKKY
jgi:uncharacterized membrane protein